MFYAIGWCKFAKVETDYASVMYYIYVIWAYSMKLYSSVIYAFVIGTKFDHNFILLEKFCN